MVEATLAKYRPWRILFVSHTLYCSYVFPPGKKIKVEEYTSLISRKKRNPDGLM